MNTKPFSQFKLVCCCLAIGLVAVGFVSAAPCQDILLEDFNGQDYGDWKAEGTAFGSGPARGSLEGQMEVSGFEGEGLVNSFLNQDRATGSLTSPRFKIERRFLRFLIGGGNLPGKVGIELLVDGQSARTATGTDSEQLSESGWNVTDLAGKEAQVRIFDRAIGGWGHINVDHIRLSDQPPFRPLRLSDYRKSKLYLREKYRPQFHFSPEVNWMNDPNGLVYYEGEYHLFYQYNPHGNSWGHMSWGHAVSTDLVHWKHLPIALHDEFGVMAFSGCCVVDWNNTSGLGSGSRPPLVAIYTGHGFGKQTQDIAFSNDRGRTWTKYSGNPVLDLGLKDFRDPKVFWYPPQNKWVMVVSLATAKKLQFYQSQNLIDWKLTGEFGPAGAASKPNWECPDLFPLAVENAAPDQPQQKWVLQVDIGGGAPAGGSGSEYFTGEFDGKKFVCDDPEQKSQWVDFGRDFYAAVSFSDIPRSDGRRIWLGWMNNWETSQLPTRRWRGSLSIPRSLTLKWDGVRHRLSQSPVKELQKLRIREVSLSKDLQLKDESQTLLPKKSDALSQYEFSATWDPGNAAESGFLIAKSRPPADQKDPPAQVTVLGYDRDSQRLFIDRTFSGEVNFHPRFAGKHFAPCPLNKTGKINLHVFVDSSSIEVFAQDGTVVMTERIFPSPRGTDFQFYAKGGTAKLSALELYHLRSIWHPVKKTE